MTPQSTFLVVAPIAAGRRAELEALLATMTATSCLADPANALVPFGRFDRLHFARFVILDADTSGDVSVYGRAPSPWPASLAFMGACDGDMPSFLDELVVCIGGSFRPAFASRESSRSSSRTASSGRTSACP